MPNTFEVIHDIPVEFYSFIINATVYLCTKEIFYVAIAETSFLFYDVAV
jgi:hypothetical protein